MRFKKSASVVGMFTMVAIILAVQLLILIVLFQYMDTSASNSEQLVAVQVAPGALGLVERDKLHPRSHIEYINSLGNNHPHVPESQDDNRLRNSQHRDQSFSKHAQRAKERFKERADENIIQKKRSKEGLEERERAPKQFSIQDSQRDGGVGASLRSKILNKERMNEQEQGHKNNEHGDVELGENLAKILSDTNEITGLRKATVRDNATDRPITKGGKKDRNKDSVEILGGTVREFATEVAPIKSKVVETRRVPRHPSKHPDLEVSELDNKELLEGWENNQLRIVRTKNKFEASMKRGLRITDSYWNTLKIPGLQPGGSVDKYISKIQAMGKTGNLTSFSKEYCDSTKEVLVECTKRKLRKLTPKEEQGRNIMFTLRTTNAYHDTRLEILFETWLTTLYPESVFIVTDGEDPMLVEQLENIGMHYINAQAGTTHERVDLCCKAGVELELMFQPENEHFDWLCHVDDDMYVHTPPLAKQFSKFNPLTEPIYLGRSGSEWDEPRVVSNVSLLGKPWQRFHFAVGGMYCLSRAMLELARPYLVGCKAFSDSCNKTQEPEDVTVGLVIGAVLKKKMTRTNMIYSHGLDLLSAVPTPFIRDQIAFSHGFGSIEAWHQLPNVVFIPGALFSIDDDITQFKSIHCHIYPTIHWCVQQKKFLVEEKRKAKESGKKKQCVCAWETFVCCEVIRSGYLEKVAKGAKERARQIEEQQNKVSVKPG